MDTIFRVLSLHMRTFWRCTRGLFVSIWFQRLHTSGSQKNASATHIQRPPTPIPPSSSAAASRIPPKISMARMKVWACLHARNLKAQMKERRIAKKKALYTRIAAGVAAVAVGKGKEGAKGEDEEDEEEVQEGDRRFEAPLSSSEPCVGTCRSPSPFLPHWNAWTSGLGLELQFDLGYDFPSPTDSCASSGSNTTAPRTPVTPMMPMTTPLTPLGNLHFPGTKADIATESPARPATLRAHHLRRDPRTRGRFRTLSASITARSPISLSFPLSFSLPLTARRASSPNITLQRCMRGGEADREDADGEGTAHREGEDPFGTHGSGYYAPGARAALGLGDAYDLSAWAWACDLSPHRRAKKRVRAATGGSASVYRAPAHAASAPQLTYAPHTDGGELEYSYALANARAGVTEEKRSSVVRTHVPANTIAQDSEAAGGLRRGMRPLLLPQKLGLLTIVATSSSGRRPGNEAERADSSSGRRESKVSGWDVDLERGVYRR